MLAGMPPFPYEATGPCRGRKSSFVFHTQRFYEAVLWPHRAHAPLSPCALALEVRLRGAPPARALLHRARSQPLARTPPRNARARCS